MDLEQALRDPRSVFEHPKEVLKEASLSNDQKIQVLRQWEYDARELEVAAEENMAGDAPSQLDVVLAALAELQAQHDPAAGTPTKQ